MAVYPAGSYVTANSEYLSRNDEAGISMGSGVSFSLVAWVWMLNDPAAYHGIIVKCQTNTINYTELEYALRVFSDDCVDFQVSGGSGGTNFAEVKHSSAPTKQTWYLIVGTFNGSTGQIAIAINAGTPQTATNASAYAKDSNGPLSFGRTYSGGQHLAGRIGSSGIAKHYVLSSSEQAELYNSGNGILWASMSSGLQAKFGSCWWDMTESSDGSGAVTRASWDGNMNLTDNNTVASADGPIVKPAVGGVGSIFHSRIFGGVLVR